MILAAAILEHRDNRAHRVLPNRAFFLKGAAKGLKLGAARTLAHAEFDAAAAHEVEGRDALGDAGRRARRQLHDAVRQADVFGALASGTEEHLGCRRVRILFEKVVLDLPGKIVAEPISQFDLVERVLIKAEFAAGLPRARQLQLIENAEFHRFLLSAPGAGRPGVAVS